MNEAVQDLGIWAYRVIGGEGKAAISRGSAIEFVKNVQKYSSSSTSNMDDDDIPGVVIANIGQLLWWRGGKRAVSFSTWYALPRKTAVHGPMRIDDIKNRVLGNTSIKEHVRYIFDEVIGKMTAKDAQIYVVGLSDGADEATTFLNDNCKSCRALVLASKRTRRSVCQLNIPFRGHLVIPSCRHCSRQSSSLLERFH